VELWHGTLLGLFVVLVAGGLGFPVPEDVALMGAGVLAHQGVVGIAAVLAVGMAGVCGGDWLVYLAGRRYGADMVRHPRLARLFSASRVEAVHEAIDRHGMRAVFFARFVLGFRIVTFLAAGTFGVPAPRFAIAEAAGSAIFVPATVTLGYLFADRAVKILHDVGQAERWLLLLGVIGIGLYLGLRALAGRSGLETKIIARVPPPDAGAGPRHPPPPPDRPS
jgi:membrane protein DedA with SNARE-associated domain